MKFTRFVPQTWKATDQTLTIHFHTAEWLVIQEHLRRGATHPVAAFYLGEGSSVYRRAFEDPKRFGRVLDIIARLRLRVGGRIFLRRECEVKISQDINHRDEQEKTDRRILVTRAANLKAPDQHHNEVYGRD